MESSIDPEKQKLAREYARIRRLVMLVNFALASAYILGWLFLNISRPVLGVIHQTESYQ